MRKSLSNESRLPLLHRRLQDRPQSILAHKLRAFLTLIGIIIGVASVVAVGASISGLNTYVTDKIARIAGRQSFHDGPHCLHRDTFLMTNLNA